MKEKEKEEKFQEEAGIISYRRRCLGDTGGTGLSHYIMTEEGED